MKKSTGLILSAAFVFLSYVLPARAMPPHPDLLKKIRSGEIPAPDFLRGADRSIPGGLNTPNRVAFYGFDRLGKSAGPTLFNAIVLLVDFEDHPAQVNASFFDTLMFDTDTTGTVNDYYNEVSYGNFNITTQDMPSTIGWIRAPRSYSYYVGTNNGMGNYPYNAQKLVEDVVALADQYVDFSQYTYDSDNYVDGLIIVHSGTGAEFSGSDDDIWSHKWSTSDSLDVDGVSAYVYSIQPEFWNEPGDMTCGVYVHELGHSIFGLPDLYDRDYSSEGLGKWSLMAGGSWNGGFGSSPAHPDAWSRIRMGFVTPIVVESETLNASIPAVENSPVIYRLQTAGMSSREYFLVENRLKTGYDYALSSQGLLIYHIDEAMWSYPLQNDNEWYPGHTSSGHYLVALEQADALWELEKNEGDADSGDPFPGLWRKRAFNYTSTPNSRDYTDTDTEIGVVNISVQADTMTADLFIIANPPDPFTLSSPTDGDTIRAIEAILGWNAVTDPDICDSNLTYIVRWATDDIFSENLDSASTQTTDVDPSYTLTDLINDTTYWWTLRAQDSNSPGTWADDTLTFHTDIPQPEPFTLILPLDGDTIRTPGAALSWHTTTDPDTFDTTFSYIVWWTTDETFSLNIDSAMTDTTDNDTSFIAAGLFDDLAYWWKVRAQDSNTNGTWTDARSFLTYIPDPPGNFALTIPQDGAEGYGETTFKWRQSTDPDEGDTVTYTLHLITAEETLSVPELPSNTISFTLEDSLSLLAFGDTITWYVTAHSPYPDTSIESNSRFALVYTDLAVAEITGNGIPKEFKIAGAYPNPFNPKMVAVIGLPNNAQLVVKVYNLLGKEVAVLADGYFPRGYHHFSFDASGMASGIYFLRAAVPGKFKELRRIVLLR